MDDHDVGGDSARLRYLDHEGAIVKPLPGALANRDLLIRLYRAMTLTRTFDAKIIALQRTGQIGTGGDRCRARQRDAQGRPAAARLP